jgi:hypothetical protein
MGHGLLGRPRGNDGRQREICQQRPQPPVRTLVTEAQGGPVPLGRVHPAALPRGGAAKDEHALERRRQLQGQEQRELLDAEVADVDRVDEYRAVVEDEERASQAQGVIRDRLAVGGCHVLVGQRDLRGNSFAGRGHQQQGRRAVQSQLVGRKVAGVAVEQAEPRNVLDDAAVLRRQQDQVIRLEQQGMAYVDGERAVCHIRVLELRPRTEACSGAGCLMPSF